MVGQRYNLAMLMLLLLPIAKIDVPGAYKIAIDGKVAGSVILNYSNATIEVYPEVLEGKHIYTIGNKSYEVELFSAICSGYNGVNCTIFAKDAGYSIPYEIECKDGSYAEKGSLYVNHTGKISLYKPIYCDAIVKIANKEYNISSIRVYVNSFYAPKPGVVEVYRGNEVILKKVFNIGRVSFPELKRGEYIMAIYTESKVDIALLKITEERPQELALPAVSIIFTLLLASIFVAISD